MWLYRLYEFLFDRWTVSIEEEGAEYVDWCWDDSIGDMLQYERRYILYRKTNKFSGSVKIKKKYLN